MVQCPRKPEKEAAKACYLVWDVLYWDKQDWEDRYSQGNCSKTDAPVLIREAGDVHRKEQSLPVKRDRQKETNGIHLTADGIPVLLHDATLERFGCTQRAIVATFHNEVTAYLDRTYPDLPRSTGVKETAKFYICSLLDLKVSQGTFSFVALQNPTTP